MRNDADAPLDAGDNDTMRNFTAAGAMVGGVRGAVAAGGSACPVPVDGLPGSEPGFAGACPVAADGGGGIGLGVGVGVGGSGVDVGEGVLVGVGVSLTMPTVATVRSTLGVDVLFGSDELQPMLRAQIVTAAVVQTAFSIA
jgi:hypothetical protein